MCPESFDHSGNSVVAALFSAFWELGLLQSNGFITL